VPVSFPSSSHLRTCFCELNSLPSFVRCNDIFFSLCGQLPPADGTSRRIEKDHDFALPPLCFPSVLTLRLYARYRLSTGSEARSFSHCRALPSKMETQITISESPPLPLFVLALVLEVSPISFFFRDVVAAFFLFQCPYLRCPAYAA